MNFRIKETGETKELHLTDPRTGLDYLSDHFGNSSAQGFTYDDDACEWVGSQGDVEWWEDYCTTIQKDEYELQELREEYGEDVVDDAIEEAFRSYNSDDYNDHHGAYQSAIDIVKSK